MVVTGPLPARAAAAYLGVSTTTLWRLSKRRLIKHLIYPLGGARYEIEALDEFKSRATRGVLTHPPTLRVARVVATSTEERRILRAVAECGGRK